MIGARLYLAFVLCFAAASASAQTAAPGVAGEPAFAEHRLTLQLSENNAEKESLVLSVAANVLNAYGPDKVAIEVVAFGPGVDLLRADNSNKALIESLIVQGVRFDVCMNTIDTIERKTGKPYPLNPQAQKVVAGVERIITLAEHGYVTVRP